MIVWIDRESFFLFFARIRGLPLERIVSADSYNTNSRRRHRCGHCGNCIIQMKSCHCFQSFLKPLFLGIPVFRSTSFLSFRMALNSSILSENQKRRYPVFYTGTVFLHIFYAFLSFRRYNNVTIWLAALAVGLHKFISLQCRVDDSSLVRIHRLQRNRSSGLFHFVSDVSCQVFQCFFFCACGNFPYQV